MYKSAVLFLFIISCPRPQIRAIPDPDYLREAEKTYQAKPLYAYNILKNLSTPEHMQEQTGIFLKLFIEQREYGRAARLLDSIGWLTDMPRSELISILLNTKRWEKLSVLSDDDLLKGIAYYQLEDYQHAIEFLVKSAEPAEYRILYLARSYQKIGDRENAFKTLVAMDSISAYLSDDYQNLFFELLVESKDSDMAIKELSRLKDESLREYVLLKIYEKQNNKTGLKQTAWHLIKKYPKSPGAYYSTSFVKTSTKYEHRLIGKVCYYVKEYDKAIKHLGKSTYDDEVNYYLGKIYYDRSQYHTALGYFKKSIWLEAYYYRGRIHEEKSEYAQAISIYDSLYELNKNSRYATRALKRKAFLLEDIGDTLTAVKTFLKIKEETTEFRAAMQLYKLGQLDQVVEVLKESSDPGFIYWQIRARERLGQGTDSLKAYLFDYYPLSYYSLLKSGKSIDFDTTSLLSWIKSLGDTAVTFDRDDSMHIGKASRYFTLNEIDYATAELNLIEETSALDLYYLINFCNQYRADHPAINYCLRLKKIAENHEVRLFPKDFLKLLYPVRYAFSIMDQGNELSLAFSLIWQESLFDPNATSTADARGLMQIIPSTGRLIAKDLRVDSFSLYDPEVSIKFGSYYFSQMTRDFNSIPLALAAYNAGPVRLKEWLNKDPNAELDEFIELIPYSETQDYIKMVLARQQIYKSLIEDKGGQP